VGEGGFEPPRACAHWTLNPARLPIPPLAHEARGDYIIGKSPVRHDTIGGVSRHNAADLLLGRYRLDAPIGRGGAGEVWRARDTRLGRPVAIKVLPRKSRGAAVAVAEARTVAALANPHVVALYELAEDEDDFFLVAELVDGASLEAVLAEGYLTSQEAAALLAPVASALGAAHRAGVVHGDVKPANVLLGREGQVKLADFGAAGFARSAGKRLRAIEASPAYAAPEVLAGHAPTTAADLYALGATLARSVGGAPTGGNLPRDVAGPVRALLKELTAEVPEDRPESADGLAEELALIGAEVDRRALTRHLAATHGVEPGEEETADDSSAQGLGGAYSADLIGRAWPALLLALAGAWAVLRIAEAPYSDPGWRVILASSTAGLVLAALAWRFLWPAGFFVLALVAAGLLKQSVPAGAAVPVVVGAPAWLLAGRRYPKEILGALLVPALGLLSVPIAAAPLLAKTLKPRSAVLASLAGAVLLPVARIAADPAAGTSLAGIVWPAAFIPVATLLLALAAIRTRWLGPLAMLGLVVGGFAAVGAIPAMPGWDPSPAYADLSLSLIIGVAVMAAAPSTST
jgi:hypothetical protein